MTAAHDKPILIAGPTASGKSALALMLAEHYDGVVINADSMQVYRGLPILTAQPSADEQARAPHKLYGHIPPHDAYSVARWIADCEREIAAARQAGKRPIVVGGTGLYFKALLEGLSPVPEIPTGISRALAERGRVADRATPRRTGRARSRDGRAPRADRSPAHHARTRSRRSDRPLTR